MGGKACQLTPEDLENRQLHRKATFAGAPLTEDAGQLAENDDALAPDADAFGQLTLEQLTGTEHSERRGLRGLGELQGCIVVEVGAEGGAGLWLDQEVRIGLRTAVE